MFYYKIWKKEEKINKNNKENAKMQAPSPIAQLPNKEYRLITGISDEGARLDLNDLVKKDIFVIKGKGRNTYYVLK